jgi:hypothetical protein
LDDSQFFDLLLSFFVNRYIGNKKFICSRLIKSSLLEFLVQADKMPADVFFEKTPIFFRNIVLKRFLSLDNLSEESFHYFFFKIRFLFDNLRFSPNLPLFKIFDSEFLSFLLLNCENKYGIKIINKYFTKNDFLFILKKFVLKEFRSFIFSDIFRQSKSPFEIFNNFVFPYLKPKRSPFFLYFYADRLFNNKFSFSRFWELNFLFSRNKVGLFVKDSTFGEFGFAFKDFFLFQKNMNISPLFKNPDTFFFEYDPYRSISKRKFRRVKFFFNNFFNNKKSFDSLRKKFGDSISAHFNSGKVIGKKFERAFLRICRKFFKQSIFFNSDFFDKSAKFFSVYSDGNLKCSKEFLNDIYFFLDESIKINRKEREFLRVLKRGMSPLKRENFFSLKYILYKKLKGYFFSNKLKFGLFFNKDCKYKSAFFKIMNRALFLAKGDANYDSKAYKSFFRIYFNHNNFFKSIIFSKKLNGFDFLGRSYMIYNAFMRLLSQYFVYTNVSSQVFIPKVLDIVSFFSKFPRHSYIFSKDLNGNFVVHTFGLDFFKFSKNDFFSEIKKEQKVFGSYSFLKPAHISNDYSLWNSLFYIFFERYNRLRNISLNSNKNFAFFFGFLNNWDLSYYKKINDFIYLYTEDDFFKFRWTSDFSEFFEIEKNFSDFSSFLDGAFISKHKFYGVEWFKFLTLYSRVYKKGFNVDYDFTSLISNFFNFLDEWAFLNSDKFPNYQLKRKIFSDDFFFDFNDSTFSFFDKFFFSTYKSLLPKDFFFLEEFYKIKKSSSRVRLDKKAFTDTLQIHHFFRTSNKFFSFLNKLHNLKLDLHLLKRRYFFSKKIDIGFLNKLNDDIKFLSKTENLLSGYIKKAHHKERDFIVHEYKYYDCLMGLRKGLRRFYKDLSFKGNLNTKLLDKRPIFSQKGKDRIFDYLTLMKSSNWKKRFNLDEIDLKMAKKKARIRKLYLLKYHFFENNFPFDLKNDILKNKKFSKRYYSIFDRMLDSYLTSNFKKHKVEWLMKPKQIGSKSISNISFPNKYFYDEILNRKFNRGQNPWFFFFLKFPKIFSFSKPKFDWKVLMDPGFVNNVYSLESFFKDNFFFNFDKNFSDLSNGVFFFFFENKLRFIEFSRSLFYGNLDFDFFSGSSFFQRFFFFFYSFMVNSDFFNYFLFDINNKNIGFFKEPFFSFEFVGLDYFSSFISEHLHWDMRKPEEAIFINVVNYPRLIYFWFSKVITSFYTGLVERKLFFNLFDIFFNGFSLGHKNSFNLNSFFFF